MQTAEKNRWWLDHYPAGVPHDIDATQYTSLVHMVEESFDKYRDRAMYTCLGKTMTFADVDIASQAIGAWLQSTGLARGARVALMMPNLLAYPVAIIGALRAGYVVVNINPLYTPRELLHQLNDSGAEAIIILENFAPTLQAVIAQTAIKHVVVARVGDLLGFPKSQLTNFVVRYIKKALPRFSLPTARSFMEVLTIGKALPLTQPALTLEDIAFLQYTGGTTGISKGAILVHANVVANCLLSEAWLKPAMDDTSKGPRPDPIIIVCALPLYHIFSLISCMWLAIKIGGHNILIPNPRDLDGMVNVLRKHKFNTLPAVNTLFNGLLNHTGFRMLDFSSLRVSNGGGMSIQQTVAEKWLNLTNTPIIEGYGLTESSSGATCNPILANEYTGDVGLPMPSTEVSIRDDNEIPLETGLPGEICLRGPQIMRGYWQRPDETEKAMTKDGFFKTGDVGVMLANGHIKIVDRKKDMILVSGFNVFPNEIENVVASCPGVLECAAVGVADEKVGEAVKLFVVKSDPNLSEETVRSYCRENLTAYKNPKFVVFRDSLPKTNVGKILRRELRDA